MIQKILYITLCLFGLLLFTACQNGNDESNSLPLFHSSLDKPSTQETQDTSPKEETELYLVVEVDQIGESLRLYRYENGMEYRYYYGSATRFHDRYGKRTTVMGLTEGSVVTLGEVDSEGLLCEVGVSDAVWEYTDVTRFSIEEQRHIFEIAGKRFSYSEETTYVFSNMDRVGMDAISQGDTLSVVGMDKQILSIRITTGQGVIALKNTTLFEGSFLQLGTKIFAEITPDMQLSVEEGTYNLIVANKGWGGSREVTVLRGQTTVVDLDELKGEGPKLGRVQFVLDVEDAIMVIDQKVVDYSKPVGLTYGVHVIEVYANGYEDWKRKLHVNTAEATIVISLTEEKKAQESQSTSSESQKEDSDENSIESQRKEELEYLKDLMTSMLK